MWKERGVVSRTAVATKVGRQVEATGQARQLRVATHRVSTGAAAVEIGSGLDERLDVEAGRGEGVRTADSTDRSSKWFAWGIRAGNITKIHWR